MYSKWENLHGKNEDKLSNDWKSKRIISVILRNIE